MGAQLARIRSLGWSLLIAGLSAGAASAQTQTNCHQTIIGMPSAGITCDSSGPARSTNLAPAAPVVFDWKSVKPVPCSKWDAMGAPGNYCDARLAAANHKAVGELIAGGKCDDALKAALGTGDLAFAREVRDFCAPK
jgi:hypothetical protein